VREECSERIRLIDEYSRLITEFNNLVGSLKGTLPDRSEGLWGAAATAHADSQAAWEKLEKHIAEHKCLEFPERRSDLTSAGVLGKAAMAAVDLILVADDNRQFVEVNEAAAEAFGLSRSNVVGRRIEEFIEMSTGETIPAAWINFVAEGVLCGICTIKVPGRHRRFEFRSKANFEPGLHLSILRELAEDCKARAEPA
jgi:PAS domain-containing protein